MLWSLCWVLAEIIQPLALVQICKKKSQVKQKKKFFIMMNDHSKISFNSRHFASATELLLSPAQKQTNKKKIWQWFWTRPRSLLLWILVALLRGNNTGNMRNALKLETLKKWERGPSEQKKKKGNKVEEYGNRTTQLHENKVLEQCVGVCRLTHIHTWHRHVKVVKHR